MAFEYDVERLTIAELIDALTIVNLKVFALVDLIGMAPDEIEALTPEDVIKIAKAGKKAQSLNLQRSRLKNAIDRRLSNIEEKDIKV